MCRAAAGIVLSQAFHRGGTMRQALFQAAAGILHDDVRREAMASAMAELGIRDAAQRIYETVQELL